MLRAAHDSKGENPHGTKKSPEGRTFKADARDQSAVAVGGTFASAGVRVAPLPLPTCLKI